MLIIVLLCALLLPPLPATVADLVIEPIAQADIPMVWCYNMAYGVRDGQRVAIMAQRRMVCSNSDFTPRQPPTWWRATPDINGTVAQATGNDWNNATLLTLYTATVQGENNVHSLWFWPDEGTGYYYYDELLDANIRGTEQPQLTWLENDNTWQLHAKVRYGVHQRLYQLVATHWQWLAPYANRLPLIIR